MPRARRKNNILLDLSRKQIEDIVDQYVRDEDDRYMFNRYYLDGIPFADIAAEMDSEPTRQTVSRRINKTFEIVIKHIYNIK